LAPEQLRTLDALRTVPGIETFYLAGGSAVALHLGHRRSLDLDLFSERGSAEDLEALRAAAVATLGDVRVLQETETSLRLLIGGVPVDAVRYPYPLLEAPVVGPYGFRVAGLRDLAAMKLSAIARRGIRRDFWDLAVILGSGMDIQSAGGCYLARFGLTQPDLYHVARALTYFEDAERDPVLPAGLTGAAWEEIKVLFQKESPRLLDGP
jgi:hypothetical protein